MKKTIRLFTTVMVCMAMALCVSCKKDDDKSDGGNHKYVDLGLPSGTLWATCNVGADKPEDYGNYYAWGETETKSTYSWNTYKWCDGDGDGHNLTKYCTDSYYGIVDGKKVLDPEDDAAHVNWGGAWRMPTREEMIELRDNCTWTWTTQSGKNGYCVTGPNGNSIFLPAAGGCEDGSFGLAGFTGIFWSNSLYTDDPDGAYVLGFVSGFVSVDNNGRYIGVSVRPVYGSQNVSVPTVTTSSVSNITVTTATCGGNVTSDGGATVTARGVCWGTEPNPTPSDNHTVDGEGVGAFTSEMTGLEPGTKYYVRAYAKNVAGTGFGEERSFTTQGNGGGGGGTGDHAYVDLGLPSGLLWATCNVGADSPEDYGDYYAWGETATKSTYNWSNYKWCNGSINTLTKYNTDSYHGTVDNKTVLDPEDDAAHVNWGGAWRMPTYDEMNELKDNCTSEWTTQNGVNGRKFTGSNGNSIFLPAAGCYDDGSLNDAGSVGRYWSSSLVTGSPGSAYDLYFSSGNVYLSGNVRRCGLSVRPVCPSQK